MAAPDYGLEARELAAHPTMRNAFGIIRDLDAWALELLIELTEIPAPPFMEEVRGRRFAELLRELGADSASVHTECCMRSTTSR
ncbi:MAG: hypothetical protein OXI83_05580, partial [Gemmatimonadota bacterium]|nr:hypothetical protein [Gemmatimonadota bacterium]